jgi:putative oxidoreductase
MRFVVALMLLQHGAQKIFGYPAIKHVPPLLSSSGVGGMVELVGGVLVLIGLFTRPAAAVLCVKMVAAYFALYAFKAWWPIHNGGELSVLYGAVFLYIAVAGPGTCSLDNMRKRPEAAAPPATPAPPASPPPTK